MVGDNIPVCNFIAPFHSFIIFIILIKELTYLLLFFQIYIIIRYIEYMCFRLMVSGKWGIVLSWSSNFSCFMFDYYDNRYDKMT